MIRLEGISKKFIIEKNKSIQILDNLNFQVEENDFVAIMGTSGVGKTTLLNIIGLLDYKYRGDYYFENQLISKKGDGFLSKIRNERIGYIFQDYRLIEDFTVRENLELSLLINPAMKSGKIGGLIEESISKVGLSKDLLNKKISKLSGGEKQRVAIARAISKGPKLIIADEPTGAIDEHTKDTIMKLLVDLNGEGRTIVMVTHDENVADYANKIYKMEERELHRLK
ncbi:ABC transporter ATP-binding protein [Peptoniphilaceae bacterium SGI.131]